MGSSSPPHNDLDPHSLVPNVFVHIDFRLQTNPETHPCRYGVNTDLVNGVNTEHNTKPEYNKMKLWEKKLRKIGRYYIPYITSEAFGHDHEISLCHKFFRQYANFLTQLNIDLLIYYLCTPIKIQIMI